MRDRIALWFAYRLPQRVLYWATIRACVLASRKFPPDQILEAFAPKSCCSRKGADYCHKCYAEAFQ